MGWPAVSGEFTVGDEKNQIVLVTLGSSIDVTGVINKIAIAGTMKTENIGIEKVIANIISNPCIRYLIICGAEVHGHLAGDAFLAIHKSGIDEKNRIVGASGAIPFISNLSSKEVERFREQVEIIDLVNVEDMGQIKQAIDACAPKDPFPAEPMIVTLGKVAEADGGSDVILTPEVVSIESRLRSLEQEVKDLGKLNKFMSGVVSGIWQGLTSGFVVTLLIFAIRRFL
ncbi:MAG: tetrahydromethanopterin S-methyltransferase subunit A [Candidatus Methanogaster sp.]|uniref:Tetrahydromethanopterin S-methyltransferase subunit A n=1 Tax=Candidatus Methanogaster sp. TaxID=3386292 RepID=A0AC61KZ18_9EURY|nr:MAG: tetrahydromethanopterin S-methyltransferase subunit A [ANME-2 cluster archaeon]